MPIILPTSTAAMLALIAAPAPPPRAMIVPVSALQQNCPGFEPAVRVNVSGLKDRSGRLKLELYPANRDDFLQDDTALLRAGKVFRRITAAVPEGEVVSLCVSVPHPGRYAVLVIHKRETGPKFSIGNDGVALPGSDHIGRRRPNVEEAVITVPASGTTVTARMQYLRGLAGFKPLSR